MKVVLAFDSFKGSLSAVEACQAAAQGIARAMSNTDTVFCPLSDGGEGFSEAIGAAAGGSFHDISVTGPLFEHISARYTTLKEGTCAVLECAQTSGLGLVPPARRSPLLTTSFGLGEMMLHAVNSGARELIIGLGGSATNDAGLGMLSALGWQFLDAYGTSLPPTGASLAAVQRIVPGQRLDGIAIIAACDVSNPLSGPHGAAYTFAAQKGASDEEIGILDHGLSHFAQICSTTFNLTDTEVPGDGAAGGLGFALRALLNASFRSGASLAFDLTQFPSRLHGADLCLTGEGQTDYQTAFGKLPAAVAEVCAAKGIPCICLSGSLGKGWQCLYDQGFTALFSLSQRPQTLEEAIAQTPNTLADTAEAVYRLCDSRVQGCK